MKISKYKNMLCIEGDIARKTSYIRQSITATKANLAVSILIEFERITDEFLYHLNITNETANIQYDYKPDWQLFSKYNEEFEGEFSLDNALSQLKLKAIKKAYEILSSKTLMDITINGFKLTEVTHTPVKFGEDYVTIKYDVDTSFGLIKLDIRSQDLGDFTVTMKELMTDREYSTNVVISNGAPGDHALVWAIKAIDYVMNNFNELRQKGIMECEV